MMSCPILAAIVRSVISLGQFSAVCAARPCAGNCKQPGQVHFECCACLTQCCVILSGTTLLALSCPSKLYVALLHKTFGKVFPQFLTESRKRFVCTLNFINKHFNDKKFEDVCWLQGPCLVHVRQSPKPLHWNACGGQSAKIELASYMHLGKPVSMLVQ